MNLFYNYKKSDLFQIIPLLLLMDKNQFIVLFGFGTKNLALVFGNNWHQTIPENEYKIACKIQYVFNASSFKIKIKKEYIWIILFGAGGLFLAYYIFNHKKRNQLFR